MFSETLIQNSPFKGQAIEPLSGKVVDVPDFVGEFQVLTETNTEWTPISVKRHGENVRSFTDINNHTMLLKEYCEEECGIGAGCWLSSIAMLSYLSTNPMSSNTRILEIGCGVALNALYLTSQGYQNVVASDYKQTIGIAFTENQQLNNIHNGEYQVLDWHHCCSDTYDPHTTIGTYDLIIATDCIYKSTAPMFFQAIKHHLSKDGGKLLLINPMETSRPGVDQFIYKLAEMGNITVEHIAIELNGKYTKPLLFVEFSA